MNCRDIEPLLSAFVDGQLDKDERSAVVSHLDTCARCRGLVSDLERLRASARVLGPMTPPDHLWGEIAGRIQRDDPSAPGMRRAAARALPQWIALAAALVLVTLGVYLVDVLRAPTQAPDPTVEGVANEMGLALQHYGNAIDQLQAITEKDQNDLDPAVASMLQKNINVIDRAIADSRAALKKNPASEPARETLLDALKRKVDVLETTVALMNEMRKGDARGAASVAGGKS